MLGQWVVTFAFFLHSCANYRNAKNFTYNILENNHFPYKKYFDYSMIALIILSVYILIRQVKYEMSLTWLFFNNYVISAIFLIEYLLRMWVYSDNAKVIIDQYENDLFLHRRFSLSQAVKTILKQKFEFILSPSAIIDLLAIMPFLHELRMLRIFVLFRVLKLFRYARSLRRLISILASKKFELLTLGLFALIMIIVSSVLIYVMEATNPKSPINTLFESLYWSVVTIFTVGYGDMVPVTPEGRSVAMIVIISGIAVISFGTSIIVTAFTEKLDDIKEEKMIEDVSKLGKFYLICGYSALTNEVVHRLRKASKDIVILEKDPLKAKEAQSEGLYVLNFDPASLHTYQMTRIHFERQVIAVILLEESDVANIYTALTIRELNKKIPLHSILHKPENRKKLSMAGIDEMVNPHELVGFMSKKISNQPVAFEVIHALRSEHGGTAIDEIILDSGMSKRFFELLVHPLFHQRLSMLGIYQVNEQSFVFNPAANFHIQAGDVAIVVANRSLVNEFRNLLHRKKGK
ncbi:MAG: ion transporter [Sulfuricurvum sp.]|nr:ion transporter [Sulfuricurvum sp.]